MKSRRTISVVFTQCSTSVNYVASLTFITHLIWPHVMLKCPLDVHVKISPEIVSHSGTFQQVFYEYCEIGHTTLFKYSFNSLVVVCDFRCS